MKIAIPVIVLALVIGSVLLLQGKEPPGPNPDPDQPDKPKGPRELKFEELAFFDFDPKKDVPKEVRDLHGKQIKITGYIYPTRQTRNIREFILMKDRGTCCYGPKTQWTHFLQVTIPKDREAISYTTDLVTLVGTFRLDPQIEEDWILGLYFLDAEEHSK